MSRSPKADVVEMLNAALACELVSMRRFLHHHLTARCADALAAANAFLLCFGEQAALARRLVARIGQLSGRAEYGAAGLVAGKPMDETVLLPLPEMLRQDLAEARAAGLRYGRWIAGALELDATTRQLLESVREVRRRQEARLHGLHGLLAARRGPLPAAG
ncbi:MAG: hypothetical protein KGL43_17335 [Burkholderiales bacterium]|nr:hypothetical protein [Burkholderiales bacterium]MDE2455353.1 hypothetical protein [Burkholderiales bacterium]